MDEVGNTTCFIGGVSPYATEEDIAKYFTPFGDISAIKVVPLKACAFVTFVSHYSAQQAIEHMNGFLLGASKLKVSWGRGEQEVKTRAIIPVQRIIPPSMRKKKVETAKEEIRPMKKIEKVLDPLLDPTELQNDQLIERKTELLLEKVKKGRRIFSQNFSVKNETLL